MTVANHDGASKRWRARTRVAARAVMRPPVSVPMDDPAMPARIIRPAGMISGANAFTGLTVEASRLAETLHTGEAPQTPDAVQMPGPETVDALLTSETPLSAAARVPHGRPIDISVLLDRGWQLLGTVAGACATPQMLRADDDWIDAPVPGTVAQALRDAGRWDGEGPLADEDLDGRDWWYVCRFAGTGVHMLRCDGLATLAEIWVDGVQRLQARNMFAMHEVELDLGDDASHEHTIHLVFRALNAPALRRQRWRQRLISAPALRGLRSTALGRMPGWCAPVPAVGPWRQISLVDLQQQWISHVDVETRVVN